MRITGGERRGRILTSPEGLQTRPTSDRARQAIFNILNHAKWRPPSLLDGNAVMDIFAGTGALGLEALSQGASHAVFVEKDPAALRACQQNIDAMKYGTQSLLMKTDCLTLGPRPAPLAPRQLVFLDPPYGQNFGVTALTRAAEQGWLAENAVIVMEMAKKQPEEIPPRFEQRDERSYGVALVRFLMFTA